MYNKEHGRRILNALYSIWLSRTVNMLNSTYEKVETILKKNTARNYDLRDVGERNDNKTKKTYNSKYWVKNSNLFYY